MIKTWNKIWQEFCINRKNKRNFSSIFYIFCNFSVLFLHLSVKLLLQQSIITFNANMHCAIFNIGDINVKKSRYVHAYVNVCVCVSMYKEISLFIYTFSKLKLLESFNLQC